MNNGTFSFHSPAEVIFGLGTATKTGESAKKLKAQKTLLVTDSGILKSGVLEPITASLQKAEIAFDIYSDVVPDPTVEVVEEGAALCRQKGIEVVVAVGGGSSIDAAKAMCALATNPGQVTDYEGMDAYDIPALPLIAIPTTAGTGSEVGAWAVITDVKTGRKFGVAGISMIPRVAICDPLVTVTMPPAVTAATGLDALTHAVEAYTNTNFHPLADLAATKAIELIGQSLLPAVANGNNIQARSDMLYASMLAGIAHRHAALGAVHGLTLPIGALFGVPHGLANGIMLPYVVEYSLMGNLERYRDVARLLGERIEGLSLWEGAAKAAVATKRLLKESGLPISLKEVGVEEETFAEMADKASPVRHVALNPRIPSREDLIALYRRAYQGFE